MTAALAVPDQSDDISLALAGPEHDMSAPTVPIRPYVICCAPRSGSTLLSEMLRRTGRMGVPAEYLNELYLAPAMGPRLGAMDADGGLSTHAYLKEMARRRTSPNGVFGIKVLFSQMERWLPSPTMRWLLGRSRLIWLRRRDIVGQAISLMIAQQTQRWHAGPGGDAATSSAVYSAEGIRRTIGTILSEDDAWGRFFAVNETDPLVVYYEDLMADPINVCGAICAAVGVADAGPFRLDNAETRPTRGALNEEWRARWHAGMRFRDHPHTEASRHDIQSAQMA